ncbi:MAG: HAD-IB family phosphatase [Euryarchaeota archaeon]|nr:HAD-IB family phosphatase [Euryarchaeota archaeon]
MPGGKRLRLVVFDCDGVLADSGSSWEYVHQSFGVDNNDSLAAYLRGEFDDAEFIRRDVRLWLGLFGRVHISKITGILDTIPLISGAQEAVGELRKRGIRTAIVSAGLEPLTTRVARTCGIDINLSNGLETDSDGYLTGEGIVRVPLGGKGAVVRSLMAELGVEKDECAAVGDRIWDSMMFDEVGTRIAFNPADGEVGDCADVVVRKKDLREVLTYLF